MHEPELQSVPNGIAGYEAIVAQAYFPMKFSKVEDPATFQSRAASCSIGPASLTRLYASGAYQARVHTERAQSTAAYVLNLTEIGSCEFHGNREAATKPGTLILIDASVPLEVVQTGAAQSIALVIPAHILASHCAQPAHLALRPLDSAEGLPAILREAVLGCWHQKANIQSAAARELLGALSQLVCASFRAAPLADALESLSAHAHFLRIRDLVLQNLASAELTVDFVSDRLGMSKSYVFAIMRHADTTLGRFILELRLERARQMLDCSGAQERSISQIAYAAGFQESSHFSRRFAERFGLPPRAYRARALTRAKGGDDREARPEVPEASCASPQTSTAATQ